MSLAGPVDEPGPLGAATPVTGSTDAARPTELRPGRWSDTLGSAGPATDTHYYSYTRDVRFSAVLVGVTSIGSAAGSETLEIQVTADDADGTDCGSASVYQPVYGPSIYGATVLAGGDDAGDLESPCLGEVLHISVAHTGEGAAPIVVQVVEERPADNAVDGEGGLTGLPGPVEYGTALPAVDPGDTELPAGTQSLTSAPAIGSGSTELALAQGEVRIWRVPLDWGQELRAGVDLPALSAEQDERFSGYGPEVSLSILDPTGGLLTTPYSDALLEESITGDPTRLATATGPVRYLSRFGDGATVPGDYYLVLAMAAPSEGEQPASFQIELETEVVGEKAGAPQVSGGAPYQLLDQTWRDRIGPVSGGTTGPEGGAGERSPLRRLAGGVLVALGLASMLVGGWRLRRSPGH